MAKEFKNLVDMQQRSCEEYASNELFGTKRNGRYEWLTFGEFAKLVDAFRGGMAKLGVEQGNKVAVISNNRVEWAVGAYASYGLGAHYVPMYEAQLPKDWKYILNDSGAVALLVSTKAIYEQVQEIVGELDNLKHVICFELPADDEHSYEAVLQLGRDNPIDALDPDREETAGLIYTSGTTGNPKGVMLSHGNLISNVNAIHEILPMSQSDRSLSFLPWAHSFGQTAELHVLLSIGASLGLAESVQTLMDNFQEVRPTLLFSVPRIFNRIYDGLQKKVEEGSAVKKFLFNTGLSVAKKRRELAEQGKTSSFTETKYNFFDKLVFSKVKDRFGGRLRYAFSGGAALNAEVARFIDDIGILVFEGYGLTETSPIATVNRPDARKIGTIGVPIPNVEIFICDEEQKVLPDGEDGEIVVVGPNVMQGYFNLDQATKDVIFDLDGKRAFRTGDMGRRDSEGFIRITGRFKEQYKLENGKYVVPSPLEEKLKLSGMVNQICVYGFNKPYNVALVVPDFAAVEKWAKANGINDVAPEALVKNDKVKARLKAELDEFGAAFKGYERPRDFALIAEEFSPQNGLLTPTLKLKRRAVNERYADLIESLYPKG